MNKDHSLTPSPPHLAPLPLKGERKGEGAGGTIRFGTDGWRGRVADDFTIPNVRAVAHVIGEYLRRHRPPGRKPAVAIGYDTRFLGDRFAEVSAEVLAGHGFTVLLSDGPVPTPTISLAIRLRRLSGGLVITASHNPAQYNGVKFKPYYAGPAEPAMTRWFEQHLGRTPVRAMPLADGLRRRRIQRVNFLPQYLAFVRRFLDFAAFRRARLRIAVDAMHGAGDHLAARALEGTTCRVEVAHGDPHPTFDGRRPEPTGEHLKELCRTVRRGRYDLGLATDGDADRVGIVDARGRFVTSQETMALLALHLLEDRRWRGGLAKTVAGTNVMAKIAERFRVPIYETPVGFKHIATLMLDGKALFGGEESGGFGISRVMPERDGTLMGLLIAEMMLQRRRSLAQLVDDLRRRFGHWVYRRRDVELEHPLPKTFAAALAKRLAPRASFRAAKLAGLPARLAGRPVRRVATTDGVKATLADDSWLLWRASGTEPLLRVYAEGTSLRQVQQLLAEGQALARDAR